MSADTEAPLLRLFVAVDLPDDVRRALATAQDELRRAGLGSLRWVRPEGIHLTLKFLGETHADRLDSIREAVATAVRGQAAFRLSLGAAGTFGGRRRPRVVWIDLEGDLDRLRDLQASVERELVAAGFPPDERDYSPHLTLARVPQRTSPGLGERIVDALAALDPPSAIFEAREVLVMRSTLGPGGAVYEVLGEFRLR